MPKKAPSREQGREGNDLIEFPSVGTGKGTFFYGHFPSLWKRERKELTMVISLPSEGRN